MGLSVFIKQIGGLYNLIIYQEKKTTAMVYVNIIAVLLSILLNIYLIKEFKGYGAAWAAVLSVLV